MAKRAYQKRLSTTEILQMGWEKVEKRKKELRCARQQRYRQAKGEKDRAMVFRQAKDWDNIRTRAQLNTVFRAICSLKTGKAAPKVAY